MSTEQDEPDPSGPPTHEEAGGEATQQASSPAPTETPEGERIAKAIARAGIASRRDAEAMIVAGRVSLNGKIIDSPAVNVTDADRIAVDDEPLPARERTRLWLLHKPRGVVTTARDPQGRQTVFEILPEDLPRVVAIGRLDINTEGLLLLTNDGGLAKVIAHPETGWLRRYRVRAFGDITQADLDKLRKGVTIDGMEYGPVEATLDRAQGDNVWLTLGLREGKNREVKRILEHLGLSVNRLIRLSFGPFQLGDLEIGLVEEIRTKVLKEQLGKTLAEEAGVDFDSPVREPIAPFGKPKKAPQPAARQAQRSERGPSARGRDAGRPTRDPARPGAASRMAGTDHAKSERRTTWHAEDAVKRGGGTRIPRRGGDPKQARAVAAERGRERVGAIKTGERRVVVERLQPTPAPPEPPRRAPPRGRDDTRGRRADGEAPIRRPRSEDRAGPERSGEHRPSRPFSRERSGEHPDRGDVRPRRERPAQDGTPPARQDRRPGGSRGAERGDAPRRARTPRDGAPPPRGERSSAGFGAGKPASGRPGGTRGGEGAGKRPGGFGGGGRPGGRPSGGGKPGGRPGGGKPGPRGGGRPPRAGR